MALTLLGCDEEEAPIGDTSWRSAPAPTDAEIGAKPVATPADAFIYATGVNVIAAHTPTRFDARLPRRLGVDASLWEPPTAYIESRVCAGDEAMRSRVLDALDRITAHEPIDQGLLDTYSNLLARCPSRDHCAWLAASARADRAYWAKQPLVTGLVWCEDANVSDIMLGSDVPARATVIWMRNNVPVVDEVVPLALDRAVRQLIADRYQEAYVDAAVTVARYPGTQAAELLRVLQDAQDLAGGGFDEYGDEYGAPNLLTHACEYLLVAPQCANLPGYREVDEADVIVAGSADQYAQVMRDPKRAAKAGERLAACVRDPAQVEGRRTHCLARLAALDWGLAKKAAAQVTSHDPMFAEALRIVTAFESRAAFRAELRTIGLIGDAVQPTFRETLSVADELQRARRLHVFSWRSGTVPVRHDILLFQLAALAGDAMRDVVFEELPPDDLESIYRPAPYVLRAYADGKRWSVVGDALDDRYDVLQTIGLLNVVAAERKSELRWVAVRDDQQVSVIVAPREAIRTAIDQGYIELGDL